MSRPKTTLNSPIRHKSSSLMTIEVTNHSTDYSTNKVADKVPTKLKKLLNISSSTEYLESSKSMTSLPHEMQNSIVPIHYSSGQQSLNLQKNKSYEFKPQTKNTLWSDLDPDNEMYEIELQKERKNEVENINEIITTAKSSRRTNRHKVTINESHDQLELEDKHIMIDIISLLFNKTNPKLDFSHIESLYNNEHNTFQTSRINELSHEKLILSAIKVQPKIFTSYQHMKEVSGFGLNNDIDIKKQLANKLKARENIKNLGKYMSVTTHRKLVVSWNLIEERFLRSTIYKDFIQPIEKQPNLESSTTNLSGSVNSSELNDPILKKSPALYLSALISLLCAPRVQIMSTELSSIFNSFQITESDLLRARKISAIRVILTGKLIISKLNCEIFYLFESICLCLFVSNYCDLVFQISFVFNLFLLKF